MEEGAEKKNDKTKQKKGRKKTKQNLKQTQNNTKTNEHKLDVIIQTPLFCLLSEKKRSNN